MTCQVSIAHMQDCRLPVKGRCGSHDGQSYGRRTMTLVGGRIALHNYRTSATQQGRSLFQKVLEIRVSFAAIDPSRSGACCSG